MCCTYHGRTKRDGSTTIFNELGEMVEFEQMTSRPLVFGSAFNFETDKAGYFTVKTVGSAKAINSRAEDISEDGTPENALEIPDEDPTKNEIEPLDADAALTPPDDDLAGPPHARLEFCCNLNCINCNIDHICIKDNQCPVSSSPLLYL